MAQNSQALDLVEAINTLSTEITYAPHAATRTLSSSLGYILAADVFAPLDMPPFPASAMDGYAIRVKDIDEEPSRAFKVVGRSLAGHPCDTPVAAGETIRVFTGAQLPPGADQVILQEELKDSSTTNDAEFVTFNQHQRLESYVRPIGHDVKQGTRVAERGNRITPFLLGTLTSYGIANVQVITPLKVGVFSTGDELVDASTPIDQLKPGQIYDSNRATVLALLDDVIFESVDLGRLPDNLELTKAFLDNASKEVDVLITSGGVSVGEADYVTRAITELGQLNIWKLNLKPGKPVAVGKISDCLIFGLPGNPVSTIVTLLLLAKPVMLEMLGCTGAETCITSAVLSNDIKHQPGRTEYQRGTLAMTSEGLKVSSTGDQSSNRLMSFAAANCLIEIDKTVGDLAMGTAVRVLPFWGLVGTA